MKRTLYLIIYIQLIFICWGCERLEIPGDDITISDIQKEEDNKDTEGNIPIIPPSEDTDTSTTDSPSTAPTVGNGSQTAPYTVKEVTEKIYEENDVWVKGFIVGWIRGNSLSGATFSATDASDTNLLLADSQDESDPSKCIPVQLPNNSVRNELNLRNHAENIGRNVCIQGDITYYFKTNGLKNCTDFQWISASLPPTTGDSQQPTTGIGLFEDFSAYPHDTPLDIKGWNISGSHSCTWITEHKGHEKFASVSYRFYNSDESYETWLFTPAINLDNLNNPILTFNTAYLHWNEDCSFSIYILETNNPGKNTILCRLDVPIANRENISEGHWLHTGEIPLSPYSGTKYIGFRYKGTATKEPATTFYLDNIYLNEAL